MRQAPHNTKVESQDTVLNMQTVPDTLVSIVSTGSLHPTFTSCDVFMIY